MARRNNISEARIPATLRLAGELLATKAQDLAKISILCGAYTDEISSGKCDITDEFAPYLFHLINEQGIAKTASTELMGSLRRRAITAASIAVARRHIIKKIGGQLAASNIKAILLKGAAMDGWVYPNEAFRLGSDIDLLVRENDYPHIDEILAPLARAVDKYPGQQAFTDFAIEKPFLVEKPAHVYLDVHRDLTIPFVYALNPDSLFERAIPHPTHDKLWTLSPEDNLLHFAIHSFYDMRLFSKQTLDAYLLIANRKINWALLQDRSKECRAVLPMAYLLRGVERIYPGIRVPEYLTVLSKPRTWAMEYLLTAPQSALVKRNLSYRSRQLACQGFLSGNLAGYARYNLSYARAKLRH